MAAVNKVILIGNLGADPDVRYTASGDPLVNLRLATTDTWRDKTTGEKRESTEWHRVVLYRKLAEIAAQYLRKGSQLYVEGKLKTRKWQDSQGVDRYSTEIEGFELTMLGGGTGTVAKGSETKGPSGIWGGREQESLSFHAGASLVGRLNSILSAMRYP